MNTHPKKSVIQQELRRLARIVAKESMLSRPVDDLVLMVCEQTGWDWDQAADFVAEIETHYQNRKQARAKIFLLMAGFTAILGGLAVFAYSAFVGFILLRNSLIREGDVLSYFFFFDFWSNGAPFFIGGMFVGLGMMAGGAYGIGKAFSQ
jgi:hypothetical protein